MMNLSTATYYADPKISRADQEEKDADLRGQIELVLVDFPKAGYRPLIHYLKRKGIKAGETRLRRVIEKFELQIRPKKKYVVTTNSNHDCLIYPNLMGLTRCGLMFLKYPQLPLHNNMAEVDTRERVIKRKILMQNLNERVNFVSRQDRKIIITPKKSEQLPYFMPVFLTGL
jgi:hypothetical protein